MNKHFSKAVSAAVTALVLGTSAQAVAEGSGPIETGNAALEKYLEGLTAETVAATPAGQDAAAPDDTDEVAQFRLPNGNGKGKEKALPTRLVVQYGWGSESEANYRINPDLDRSVSDDLFLLTPQLNGYVTYRPTDWLEGTLEMILDREIAILEKDLIMLPDGSFKASQKRRFSLTVDQAFVTLKEVTDPLEFSLGRINYEDQRHWLYDSSIDAFAVAAKLGDFRVRATAGREQFADLDILKHVTRDRINTYLLYTEYRGIEDNRIGGYVIYRHDLTNEEGRPVHYGLRSQGAPTESLSYWAEMGFLGGHDEMHHRIWAYAVDVGGTYQFIGVPLNPNITLGFAMGSGDGDDTDTRSNNFRQTGIHSNETKFAGLSAFKVYGEVLDPELSNVNIFTAAAGIRPYPNVSVDVVYHYYRLREIADEIRNWALTAQMNQIESEWSKDVGSALDVVVGFRNLFGIRSLGIDVRAGLFFPGKAFKTMGNNGNLLDADKGGSVIVKFWL